MVKVKLVVDHRDSRRKINRRLTSRGDKQREWKRWEDNREKDLEIITQRDDQTPDYQTTLYYSDLNIYKYIYILGLPANIVMFL